MVGISGLGDGENYVVRFAKNWVPGKTTQVDFDDVRAELRRKLVEYNVVEICYDPYQLEDMANTMRKELIAHVVAFNQQKDRLIADKGLYDSIRDRHIRHYGYPELSKHVQNANAKNEQEKLRIVKRNDLLKIDMTVAMSMALARAKKLRL